MVLYNMQASGAGDKLFEWLTFPKPLCEATSQPSGGLRALRPWPQELFGAP